MNHVIALLADSVELISPFSLYFAGAVLMILTIIGVICIKGIRLMNRAVHVMEAGENDESVTAELFAHPGLVERLIKRKGDGVITYFGMTSYLLQRLETRKKPEDVKRLLDLVPEAGIYQIFTLALHKESIERIFRNWLKEHHEIFLVRKMALESRGGEVDCIKSYALLSDCIRELHELSGDPEWTVRYFSLNVLLLDDHPKSRRLVREFFNDPHPLLRRVVAEKSDVKKHEILFESLMTLVLDDPVFEVRNSARQRIHSTFPDKWKLNPVNMNAIQTIHVLEFLETSSREDENIAMTALQDSSIEVRMVAARFLEKAGALERILLEAHRGDRKDWKRRESLLHNAVAVNVSGFLGQLELTRSTDVLLLGSKILAEGGDPGLIASLAEKAFSSRDSLQDVGKKELYRSVIILACNRGDERAHRILRDELKKMRRHPELPDFILPQLPSGEAPVYRDVLLGFLTDEEFHADEAFLEIMSRVSPSMFLGKVLDILEADRCMYSSNIRLRALKCLGTWHLDYTLQTILENLPVLPMDQIHEFALNLGKMNQKILTGRIDFMMSSPDSGVKASLIRLVSVACTGSFSREIREGLNDADQEIRIASLHALFEVGELKANETALALLHDPVERVRVEAARIAGMHSKGKFLNSLENLLNSDDESSAVKIAAMEGLAASKKTGSIGVMVRFLRSAESLQDEMITALARKTDKKSLTTLIGYFRDSEASLRDRIADVFTAMGEQAEEALVELLKEESASLKPLIADILTRTGFVELLIRKLSHRKSSVRREVAELLTQIASDAAYRGIVLAVRDPDCKVRIMAIRALEVLNSPAGERILESLENDPDKKVRRYTAWAIERLKARNLP